MRYAVQISKFNYFVGKKPKCPLCIPFWCVTTGQDCNLCFYVAGYLRLTSRTRIIVESCVHAILYKATPHTTDGGLAYHNGSGDFVVC